MGYVDGMNSYVALGAAPLRFVDPTGLWTEIERSNKKWAVTCAEQDQEDVTELAKQARLNAGEAIGDDGWLRHTDEKAVKSSAEIEKGQYYYVPNTFAIVSGNPKSKHSIKPLWYQNPVFFARYYEGMTNCYKHQYESRGFKVLTVSDIWGKLLQRIIKLPDLYGLMIIAHADETGIMSLQPNDTVENSISHLHQVHHRLADLIMCACNTDKSWVTWMQAVSEHGTLRTVVGTLPVRFMPAEPWTFHAREAE